MACLDLCCLGEDRLEEDKGGRRQPIRRPQQSSRGEVMVAWARVTSAQEMRRGRF